MEHLLSIEAMYPQNMVKYIDHAVTLKTRRGQHEEFPLEGQVWALLFSKSSTRTRVSFEVGIHQLGGQPLALNTGSGTGMQMGRGETIHDTAKVLSRFVHGIVIRTFGQDQVDGLAEHGSVPVVNALTDLYHPCQGLADLQTIREHLGTTKGKKLVYLGAGNNVAHTLMLAGPRAGMDVVIGCPDSLRPNQSVLERARADASKWGTRVAVETDAEVAVKGPKGQLEIPFLTEFLEVGHQDSGVIVTLCTGQGAVNVMVDRDQAPMHDGHQPDDGMGGQQHCPFAASVQPAVPPLVLADLPLPAWQLAFGAIAFALKTGIIARLAAPPPPSSGPPATV